MNVEKDTTTIIGNNMEIHIPIKLETTKTTDKTSKETQSSAKNVVRNRIKNVWNFYAKDINKMMFPFKVGLAVLLVSLLILHPTTSQYFGANNLVWAVITTAIMFEYTVGATFKKGFNRAIGSSLAAMSAITLAQLAFLAGTIAHPILIGLGIFLLGTITTFMKTWPSLVQYEYAFRVTLFTFCLIIVYSYRMGHPIKVAMDRLLSVAIGGIIAVLVNVLVFPAWAGEELHKGLVDSFYMIADALEECVKKYLEFDGSKNSSAKLTLDEFPDEPAYNRCRNSVIFSNKFQTLANSARWEPPHGKFKQFAYPWLQYVKIGTSLRHCAFEIMALHGILHSELQVPCKIRLMFEQEITDVTNQATKLLRILGDNIINMKQSLQTSTQMLKQLHNSVDQLQWAIIQHSYNNIKPNIFEETLLEPNGLELVAQNDFLISPCHKMMTRKNYRRLHSCPSIATNLDLKGKIGNGYDVDAKEIYRMWMLEYNALSSIANFASLLIEFVAKIDYLVEMVDELSKMAKFNNHNAINPI